LTSVATATPDGTCQPWCISQGSFQASTPTIAMPGTA